MTFASAGRNQMPYEQDLQAGNPREDESPTPHEPTAPPPDAVESLRWWRRHLDGAKLVALPRDGTGTGKGVRGERHHPIADELAGALARLPAAQQSAAVVGAAALLVRVYTGEQDVIIGCAAESSIEAEPAMLPLRLLVERRDAGGLRAQAACVLGTAWHHRAVGATELSRLLQDEDVRPAGELLPVTVGVQVGAAASGGPMVTGGQVPEPGALLDLRLRLDVPIPGLSCRYDSGSYHPASVAQMLEDAATALATVLRTPEAGAEIAIPGPAKRRHLLVELNRTERDHGQVPVHRLIEARLAEEQDRVALISGDRQMSRGELRRLVDRLAATLVQHGVKPHAQVGVMLPRAPELIIAFLATLKAGAVYVPLDPTFPPDRLAFMLADSGAALLLTDSTLAGQVSELPTPRLLLDRTAWAQGNTAPPEVAVGPEDVAYLIYTSGSTGRPKGVEVPHGALTNTILSVAQAPELTVSDVSLFMTTVAFDPSITSICVPLLVGARLVIAGSDESIDGPALVALTRRHGVTALEAAPSRFRLMLEAGWVPERPLKITTGGEVLSRQLAGTLLRFGELWNMYGPTEAAIVCSRQRVQDERDKVLIGRPISNTRIYILDRDLQLVPQGGVGELCIGGRGVARGYRNLPELTAERFVSDPFGAGRLYRSGDLARWTREGALEFLGRIDHQIKLRGFRIEPGEIKTVLEQHPQVAEAVVLVRELPSGQDGLVAYVAVGDQGAAEWEALRAELAQQVAALPAYMRPQAIVPLPSLPLLANGKLDRKALPAPLRERAGSVSRPPDPGVEQELAPIWCELLGLPAVSRDDHFFDLGGTSLLTARLQARIASRFGVRLSLSTLYRAPRLADLAAAIAAASQDVGDEDGGVVALQREGTLTPLIALNNTYVFHILAQRFAPDRPFLAIQIDKLAQLRAHPTGRLESIAAIYVRMIRAARPHGPYILLGWCAAALLTLEVARQLQAQGETIELLVMIDPLPAARRGSIPDGLLARWRNWRSKLHRAAEALRSGAAPDPQTALDGMLEAYMDNASLRYRADRLNAPTLLCMPLESRTRLVVDSVRSWQRLLADCTTQHCSGDHSSVLRGAGAGEIADAVRDRLHRDQPAAPGRPRPA